jgi:predicted small secreted protein
MKKLVLCIISVALLSVGMMGCGNSPDGDAQKLKQSAPVSIPSL